MVIFESEQDIVEKLDLHDQLVRDCASGKLEFWKFCEAYNNFFYYYALDGHEADEEELALLYKYEQRILFHEKIAEEVLGKVCSDEDAEKPDYIKCGRFGSKVAVERLSKIVGKNA
ncbi:MAG: hypothetical protein NXI15_09055 [Gammaproteobacteria bacterium]|nr:hypothetical protein [Gammaproteobacteria bacterium]